MVFGPSDLSDVRRVGPVFAKVAVDLSFPGALT